MRWTIKLDSPAIKQLLLQQLYRAIVGSELGDSITPEAIPLQRVEDENRVFYGSAIALKLANLSGVTPFELATKIAAALPQAESRDETALEFTTEIVDSGWIYFHLSDRSLAVWLQSLIDTPVLLPQLNPQNRKTSVPLFPIQYAHARCCSLLRLGEQQGLIQLGCQNNIIEPHPIPWLNPQQQLCCVHPAERLLMGQFLRSLDRWSQSNANQILKLATGLSDATHNFDRCCRIFGEVQQQTPELAQARLALLGVARSLLKSMLEKALGTSAPVEL